MENPNRQRGNDERECQGSPSVQVLPATRLYKGQRLWRTTREGEDAHDLVTAAAATIAHNTGSPVRVAMIDAPTIRQAAIHKTWISVP